MALAQERADLVLGLLHVLAGADLDRDGPDRARVRLARAEDLLLRRRDRDEHHVVLVLAPRVLPLAREDADHRERHLLDPDDLPEGLGLAEEVEGRRLADERDFGGPVDVLRVDLTAVHDGPVARLGVVDGDALDDSGPVEVPVHDLRRAADRGRGDLDGRDLAGDRGRVVLRDRELAAGAEPDPARGDAAREHDEEIRAEALNLLGHARLGAGADADHRDDGGDADDDAEHRERAPKLVDAQRADGDPDALPDAHAAASSAGCEARACSASSGAATGSSLRSLPSRNERTRPA